jgi:nucleoid-associated protein YgaU
LLVHLLKLNHTLKGEEQMLKEKYQTVLDLEKDLDVKGGEVKEEAGKLKLSGTAPYELEKDMLWDAIKSIPGWEKEVAADFKVANKDIFGVYTVQKGDTLSKIAKKYLDNPNRYNDIFTLNKDILKDPDQIQVGQKLRIPNR